MHEHLGGWAVVNLIRVGEGATDSFSTKRKSRTERNPVISKRGTTQKIGIPTAKEESNVNKQQLVFGSNVNYLGYVPFLS